ncbi:DNA repair protein RadA [Patescibacteria group bacterium]|nr:DNA repair protein RadA [Patescibacteria group bacterium]HPD07973.1 DNA repair protein RadA [bacterium]HRT11328.1 DNA repair protein RadA [Patescibacteria group bacterium]HRU90094.1 DNA repair protein RadA [Patescibacteria group bacterium]
MPTIFTCTKCGAQAPKWSGRCNECGAWGTMVEEAMPKNPLGPKQHLSSSKPAQLINWHELPSKPIHRYVTGLIEIDRVLGGGLVPGSLILLSGEPGCGKSTLVAQIAQTLDPQLSIIYISGEESAQQVKMRLDRLNYQPQKMTFASETNAETIIATAIKYKPQLLIIDSIQTVYSDEVPSEPGSVNQIKACTIKLLELAKEYNITVILIGHLTKEGIVAGPKTLEHLVDTVIYLENESQHSYSLIRASKNRFGSTNEVGLLEMTGHGFRQLEKTTSLFIQPIQGASGSAISCLIEGSRPFLLEVQALVSKTYFGYPQRKAIGFDSNRLQILTTVLTKQTKINLTDQDVIVSVAGGLKINETALDLAVCAAIASSYYNRPLPDKTLFLGEVGLAGEIRPIGKLEIRLKEALKIGISQVFLPAQAKITSSKMKIKTSNNLLDFFNQVWPKTDK